jgi:hypothetical protein
LEIGGEFGWAEEKGRKKWGGENRKWKRENRNGSTERSQSKLFAWAESKPFGCAQGRKVRNIRGKIRNVGAPTFLGGGIPPVFA